MKFNSFYSFEKTLTLRYRVRKGFVVSQKVGSQLALPCIDGSLLKSGENGHFHCFPGIYTVLREMQICPLSQLVVSLFCLNFTVLHRVPLVTNGSQLVKTVNFSKSFPFYEI